MSNKNEILSLTGLRFIAALYVFLFHIEIRWPFSPDGIIQKVIAQGAIGMTIFFVLSGFLLAYQYSDRYADKKSYFLRRLARIYPIYVVAALATLPWIWGPKIGVQTISGWDTFLLVLANIFAVQAWVPSYFNFWNDGGSWSISVEVFCYAVLPFLAPLMGRLSNRKLGVLVGFLYLWVVVPGQLARFWPELSFPFLYALPAFRLPEFLLGVCGFLAVQRGFKFSKPNLMIIGIFISAIILIKVVKVRTPYIGLNWFVVPMVVMLVLALRQSTGRVSAVLSSDIFVWLGKISYCFYSFQALLLFTLITFHKELIEIAPVLGINWVLCLSALLTLIALSAFGYHFIEEPCRKKIQAWGSSRRNDRLANTNRETYTN